MDSVTSVSRRALLIAGSVGFGAIMGKPKGVTRQELLAEIDRVTRRWGVYTAYQLEHTEYVGTITHPESVPTLEELGYESNPLSATKYHPETEATHDGSWRRVDPENPRWQWHVHYWERHGDARELFSHYEYRPDPWLVADETTEELRQRLRDHYNPKWDTSHPPAEANYFLGKACERIREVVDRRDDGAHRPGIMSEPR